MISQNCKKIFSLILLFLLGGCAGNIGKPTLPEASRVNLSGMQINLWSDQAVDVDRKATIGIGELLLIDPMGRKTGFIADTQSVVSEIPDSDYDQDAGIGDDTTGAPGEPVKELGVPTPGDGT